VAGGDVAVSVVVPVWGCEPCLRELHRRLGEALSRERSYELLFVDDRSPDRAWQTLSELAADDEHVRVIRLSRNFGQQAAITAGLARATGGLTVVMDCDLQDPPELVPTLLDKAAEGFDVVLTRRVGRHRSPSRQLGAAIYFIVLRGLLRAHLDPTQGAFSVLSRRARAAFLQITDRNRHYVPIVHWIGFEQAQIEYEPNVRPTGQSSYTLRSLFALAVEGIFFQTTTLLRYVIYTGFTVCVFGFGLAAYDAYARIFLNPPSGFTSLSILLLVLSGFIIISSGIAGLYIGQVFQQVKGRPLYLIEQELHGTEVVIETEVGLPAVAASAAEHEL
jgi:glycosyltransferase involved in cell wall biosynthesis